MAMVYTVQKYDAAEGRLRHDETVPAGQTSTPVAVRTNHVRLVTVTVSPGGGGTALIEYTADPLTAVDAGTATWAQWEPGAVSATTVRVIDGPITALRCRATSAAATWSLLE